MTGKKAEALRRGLYGFFLALAWLAPGTAMAGPPPYEAGAHEQSTSITVYSEYLRDPEARLSFSDIRSGNLEDQFTPASGRLENRGFSRDVWWVRFAVRNVSDTPQRFLLELSPGAFSHVSFMAPASGSYEVRESGTRVDPPWADVRYRNQLFHLELEPGESRLYHLRLVPRYTFLYELTLHGGDYPPGGSMIADHLYMLLSGILLGLMLYNLGTFVLYGGKAYLHYAVFLGSATLASLTSAGFVGTQYLSLPALQGWLEQSTIFLAILSSMAFSRHFLQCSQYAPLLDRILAFLVITALFGVILSGTLPHIAMMIPALVLGLGGILVVLWLSLLALQRAAPQARLHLFARLPVLFVGTLVAMMVAGLVAPPAEPGLLLLGAVNLEALLLAIGLGRRSRDELQHRLEERRRSSVAEAHQNARTETLSRLSHEIRTPMSGILGMAEILRDTPLSPNQRECVQAIEESGEGLLRQLNDVLEHARLEDRTTELEQRPVDPGALVMEVMELFRERAEERQIELITHLHTNIPARVETDPGRLRQLLTSILGICLRHAQAGELIVDVARDVSGRPDHFSFEFEGSALATLHPEDLMPLLSDEPEQRDDSTRLTLSIARQLIELLDGQAGIRQGRDSPVVRFSLPLPVSMDVDTEPLAEHERLLAGRSMLVVDDSPAFARVIWQQALSWGMRVTTLQDPREALAGIRTQLNLDEPYDIVLFDQHMPGMDGIQLARRIQDDPHIAPVPVLIMLSGVRGAPSAEMARKVGIRRVVGKPVSGPYLRRILAEELGMHASTGESKIAQRDTDSGDPRPGLRVLVAEDHQLSQKVIRGILEKMGLVPLVVHNGREAVEAWREENPDIILMDCEMPGMDGFEAARIIRAEEAGLGRRRVPILALTAHIMREHRQRSREAGMDDHVPKPVEMETLRRAIVRFTDDETPPDSGPSSDGTPG